MPSRRHSVLCSRCSRQLHPIVAIDIDGTLGDYYGHLHHFAERYLGRRLKGKYDGSTTHREFYESMGVPAHIFREIKLAFRAGSMKRSMPPYTDWIEMVHKVKQRGAELWLTTTRPYLRMDNIDPDTRHWLQRHEVPYDFLLYDETKYQELAHRVDRPRVVAVLDDVDEMYDDAEAMFGYGVPILRRNEYNGAVVRPFWARTPKEAYQMISDRIERYERHYG